MKIRFQSYLFILMEEQFRNLLQFIRLKTAKFAVLQKKFRMEMS